jgi:ubiquinone/menaquinone biosynthesis C-methylase UbiE
MPTTSDTAYQRTPADYLTLITQLFGAYKKRAFAFMDLQPGQSLLDAGCGTGDDLLAIHQVLQGQIELTGVDMDATTLEAARKRAESAGANVAFHQGDLGKLPFSDACFDVVRSDRVFQHLTDPMGVLNEMIRVTRPGGRIVAIDVDWGTLVLDHPQTEFTDRLTAFSRDHHTNGRSGRQLYRWLQQAGLSDIEGYADAVCVRDWEVAGYIWGLNPLLGNMVSSGGASQAEADAWLTDAAAHAEAGLFCGSMTGFVMKAVV